jgi:hypothetical protein
VLSEAFPYKFLAYDGPAETPAEKAAEKAAEKKSKNPREAFDSACLLIEKARPKS